MLCAVTVAALICGVVGLAMESGRGDPRSACHPEDVRGVDLATDEGPRSALYSDRVGADPLRRRASDRTWQTIDALVAASFAATMVWIAVARGSGVVFALAAAVFGATVAMRRRWPVGACGVALVAAVGAHVSAPAHLESLSALAVPPLVLDFYALGRHVAHRRHDSATLQGGLLVLATFICTALTGRHGLLDAVSSWAFFCTLPFIAGWGVASRDELAGAFAAENAALAREQQERLDWLKAQERTRIARELHDVVAHSASVMVIQAVAARSALRRDPVAARRALEIVEQCGLEGIAEMRQLVGLLRRGDGEEPATPSLGDVRALVSRARGAGLRVRLCVTGDEQRLAPGVELTAYRIVQEALTNVIKHVGPTSADVEITYGTAALEIAVVNAAPPCHDPAARSDDIGRGLVGMRERLRIYDGELDAGPVDDGGFRVRARVPLGSARSRCMD
jgi:signal transduction histidine kinase